ncbi:AraC family transcriptional regulator [Paenibacillus albidus]|uniref:AraC family transcriptional regulator n=1 Tax=Paenibacillus albidus TaxID=2041023 RepID=UPI0016654CCF|nr:AraC family transcriptional regulator [Paenibacillus albidus]
MSGSLFQKALIDGDYSPRFFAYYYKQWTGYRMSYHQHDSTEIMYLISGGCVVDVMSGEGREDSFRLKRGELIILDANIPHRLIVEEGTSCRMLNVEFGFSEYGGVAPSVGRLARQEEVVAELLQNPFTSLVLPDPEDIYYVLKSLVLELDQRRTGEGSLIDLLFSELLLRLARLRREQWHASQQPAQIYVRRSIEFMHQNYDQAIQVKDIAAAVSLHPGYLHRIFKEHTSRTLTDYLTMLRMEKSKMLLGQSDIPIVEIADYVGISSRQYFHLLFKKYAHCTPVEYRNSIERHKWNYGEQSGTNISEDI